MHHSATREPLINPEYSPTGSSRARNSVVSAQFRVYQVQATPVQTVEGTLIRDEPSLPVHNAVLVETRRERFRKWYSARRQSIAGMIESIGTTSYKHRKCLFVVILLISCGLALGLSIALTRPEFMLSSPHQESLLSTHGDSACMVSPHNPRKGRY